MTLFLFFFFALSAIVLALSYLNIPERTVVVLEWRTWISGILASADPSHVIAREGEQGIEARHFVTGVYWPLCWRLFAKIHKFPFVDLADDECMTITATDGEPLPTGQVFGTHLGLTYLSDGAGFLREHGCKGPQDWVVGPGGTWAFNQALFKHKILPRIEFLPTTINDPVDAEKKVSVPTFGLITSFIGKEIEENVGQRLLGQRVGGHNNFQYINAFLEGDGTWSIATRRPIRGQRGPQREVAEAAVFLHPLAFRSEQHHATIIPQGYLGVRISNVGDAPMDPDDFLPCDDPRFIFRDENGPEHQRRWVRVLKPEAADKKRGVRPDSYHPGTRLVSPWVERVVLVDTTEVKVCFDKHTQNTHHPDAIRGPMRVVNTSEGFRVDLHIEIVIQVHGDLAPMLVSLSGGLDQFIRDFVAPTAERAARVVASRTSVEVFISERDTYGNNVENALRVQLGIRYVDLVSFNLTDIEFLDEEVKERLRATTKLSTLDAQEKVETKRKNVERLAGEADAAKPAAVIGRTAKARKTALDELLPSDGFIKSVAGAVLADPEGLSTALRGKK